MNTDEINFRIKEKAIKAFADELKALMQKHNIKIIGNDTRDSGENYAGTDYYFTVNGEPWYVETINEILDN